MNIAVFCAANSDIDNIYFEKTQELGKWIGENGHTVVFGGCNVGLMGCIAQSVRQHGGRAIGVVPEVFAHNPSRPLCELDELIVCKNLSDRKDIIIARSEDVIALPGGVGTLDEVFHLVAQASVGYHKRRVILYNIEHFWEPLIEALRVWKQKKVLRQGVEHQIVVANDLSELATLIAR